MRRRGRVGRREPAQTGDVARQVEDSGVINVVKHRWSTEYPTPADCLGRAKEYIGADPMAREGGLGASMASSCVEWECGVQMPRPNKIFLPCNDRRGHPGDTSGTAFTGERRSNGETRHGRKEYQRQAMAEARLVRYTS